MIGKSMQKLLSSVSKHVRGGMVVYRFAQWYPDLVTHVFSVATPYLKVQDTYTPTEELVATLPNFGYQLQLGSQDHIMEKSFTDKTKLRKFLRASYGGQVPSQANLFSPETGFNIKAILNEEVSMSPLLSAEVWTLLYHEAVTDCVGRSLITMWSTLASTASTVLAIGTFFPQWEHNTYIFTGTERGRSISMRTT